MSEFCPSSYTPKLSPRLYNSTKELHGDTYCDRQSKPHEKARSQQMPTIVGSEWLNEWIRRKSLEQFWVLILSQTAPALF